MNLDETVPEPSIDEFASLNFLEELHAISNLDFEKALEFSQKRNQLQAEDSFNEQIHYEEQAQMLLQQNFDDYNEELNFISQQYLENARRITAHWQEQCQNLVIKHREEANKLESQWRKTRHLEFSRNSAASAASLETARILALCENYDEAIDVRNSAQNRSEVAKPPEVKRIDREFYKRYKIMTKRHYSEYQLLHKHLKSLLKSLRNRAETLKKNAESDLRVEEARNNTLIIQTLVKDGANSPSKEKVIQSFSPRKNKKGFSGTKATSFVSDLSYRSGSI